MSIAMTMASKRECSRTCGMKVELPPKQVSTESPLVAPNRGRIDGVQDYSASDFLAKLFVTKRSIW